MKHFKEKLEIETLKALTYTQINELLNKLTLENKELKKQLTLSSVSHSKVFEAYGKPFTSGRDLWDWLNDNCEIRLKT